MCTFVLEFLRSFFKIKTEKQLLVKKVIFISNSAAFSLFPCLVILNSPFHLIEGLIYSMMILRF